MREETKERFVEWDKRKCCCLVMDARGCLEQRTASYDAEDQYEYHVTVERCECACHRIWEVEDWVNDYPL